MQGARGGGGGTGGDGGAGGGGEGGGGEGGGGEGGGEGGGGEGGGGEGGVHSPTPVVPMQLTHVASEEFVQEGEANVPSAQDVQG